MNFQKEEDFIFPAPKFHESVLETNKDYLIEIPTGRKNDNQIEEKIPCLFKKYPNSNKLLILFHCNGIDIFSLKNTYDYFAHFKMNLLIPEYPGYSLYKTSSPSSKKCLENSLIIYDFCLKNIKNISEKKIFIFGRSLGTGPAIYLASQRNPAGIFLLSPYTTFAEVGKSFHKEEFYNKLTQHLRSIDYVDKVKCPICFCHGKNDKLIDCKDSIELFEKCEENNKREIFLIDGMGHNDIYYYIDEILEIVVIFIKKFSLFNFSDNENENSLDLDKKFYHFNDK
jgi:esterase/lipase